MVDDLAPIREKLFSEVVGELERLLSHSNRAFLLGAGCSRCAGLPLTMQLTDQLLSSSGLGTRTKSILSLLKTQFDGSTSVTIEDYLSELVDLIAISERRSQCGATLTSIDLGGTKYELNALQDSLDEIKIATSKLIDPDRVDISVHREFIRAVHRSLRAGKTTNAKPVDYFVLNYDTLIEDALGLERVRYTDGFCGGATAWWDQSCFSADSIDARVFKIHGSIDWCLVEGDPLPRRVRSRLDHPEIKKKRVLIWPAATKYRETQNDPYAQLIELMRRALQPNSGSEVVLTVCGYRFGDPHINLEIDHALRESEKRLTLLIFTEFDEPENQLKKWINDPNISDQVRIHTKRGFFHGNKSLKSSADMPWWKFEVLTRLLGGER